MAELITPTAERESLGGGVYRTTVHLAPVAYADASGVLRRIAADWSDGDGTYPHVVSAARMRVRTAPNGDRLLLPVPGDDEAWFSISSPFINVGGSWTQPSLGSFTRTGNQLTATAANVITRINHAGHYIKAEYELLNGWTPQNGQFAYRVGLQGLTRQGGTLLYNGVPVMQLRKPVAYDADNEQDVREITHDFVQLGGNSHILFTLPSLAGMARPVVDPTFSVQPDGTAGVDAHLSSAGPTINYGTNQFGDSYTTSSGDRYRFLAEFDLSSIPAGATVSSATYYRTCRANYGGATIDIHRVTQAWTEAGATWNTYDGSNNWTTAGGDYDATADASNAQASFVNGTEYTWTVTALAQEWLDGTANNGMIALVQSGSGSGNHGMPAYSSDHATAANRPKLVIEYTEGGSIPAIMHHRRQQGMS